MSVIRKLALLLVVSFAGVLSTTEVMAETHVYRGRYTNYSDILYTWDGEHLYAGRYTNYSDILYTWDGKHLYKGRYTNYSDILFTWDGKHLYRGRYANYSDILYTWDGKHLYKGRYTNYSDIIYTYDGHHLYRGRYTNYSDIIMTIDGPIPVPIMLLSLQKESTGRNAPKTPNARMVESMFNLYREGPGNKVGFILDHSRGARTFEIDVPMVYADYYFLEALLRKRNIENK